MTKPEAVRKGLYVCSTEDLIRKMKGRRDCTLYISYDNRFEIEPYALDEMKMRNINLEVAEGR